MRYFFEIAYKGTRYSGWQRQPNSLAIQEVFEQAFERVLGHSVNCIGCGRTDAGVHARQFYFHSDIELPLRKDFQFVINKNLPDDLAVLAIHQVQGHPHAQFDVIERTYHYHLHTQKSPFLAEISAHYPEPDILFQKMERAVALTKGEKDFRAFCKTPARYPNTNCHMTQATLTSGDGDAQFTFGFTANRFLRGMIRQLVGTILEVGRGNLSVNQFEKSLHEQHPLPHINIAHPQGLHLTRVVYPQNVLLGGRL